MMSDKDNNLLKSDILTVGSELSEKLNAIGVPNTFGKASEGKDNLMSIIRMTISGLDMTIDQIREILRDYYNKSEVNTLLNGKSDTSHNHDSTYANISHNHDSAYASKSHQHDGADVILSNSNDVGTEIGNIENDITSINGNITSLNNSLTNFLENNKFIVFYNGSGVDMYVNKATGMSYLEFNKNLTVDANNNTVIHAGYAFDAVEVQYCPSTSVYCPTSRNDIFLHVSYVGDIKVYNRGSSALKNGNVQAMVTWKAKGHPNLI